VALEPAITLVSNGELVITAGAGVDVTTNVNSCGSEPAPFVAVIVNVCVPGTNAASPVTVSNPAGLILTRVAIAGGTPDKANVGAGVPVAVTWNVPPPPAPSSTLMLFKLVIVGGTADDVISSVKA